jgi:rhamnulokinase
MNDVAHARSAGGAHEKLSGANGDSGAQKRPALVAVDLGAESCRVSLLRWVDGHPEIRLIHRFANAARLEGNDLRWDIEGICKGVEEGLRACAQLAPEGIAAIGVDGWAVDYVRLSPEGTPLANPFCYRDPRNVEALGRMQSRISPDRLYQLTGVQIISLNTLYQLHADREVEQALPWINLPEYLLHRLGGKRVSEYTNATHTQLLSVRDQNWCAEIFQAAGLDLKAAPPVVKPGTNIGELRGELASLPSFRDTRLIAPACHDTASAIAGIPAQGDDWAFISSGTWSLVGCVLNSACVSDAARSANFSNEGGVGGKIYFLKNVNGMWLLRQCMEQWRSQGQTWTVEQLVNACANLEPPDRLIDVDEPDLLLPGNMPARINAQLSRLGQAPMPDGPPMAPRMANLIFHSLAARYAAVLRDATSITGKELKRLYVVGGGSKNAFLNRLTAKATGLDVQTGSTESATVGNLAIQLASLAGDYTNGIGVAADAVARWASVLAAQPIDVPGNEVLGKDVPGNSIRAHKVEESQRPTGKALA